MSAASPIRRKFRFGVFQLDPTSGELFKHGIRMKLQDQPLQVLAVLVERPGGIVTREELRQRIWDSETFVDFDHSLNISINKLRDCLGDSASNPRFIETVPRRGYRFLAPVSVEEPPEAVQPPPPARIETVEAPPPGASASGEEVPSPGSPRGIWLTAAVAAVVLIGGAIWLWSQRAASRNPSPGRVMLAVLPFEDLTADRQDEYFIAGLHDELIAQLGRLYPEHLGVIARTSVAQYGANRKPVDQIGRELHVNYVLEGTVRMVGQHFRITAALIQVSDQTQLWVETYEPKMEDILGLQEDVARKVSSALSMEFLPDAEQRLRQNTTHNAAAYEAYLRGRFLWYQETRPSLEAALAQFRRAIELDPTYAPAYVGLADAYDVLGGYGFIPAEEAFTQGKAAAAKALALAPNLSDAYNSMAFASFYYDWNWSEADRQFRKALELNPNNQLAHEFYSSFLHAMGRLDEAEAENHLAQELDPMSGWLRDDKGWMLLSRRRPVEAIPEFRKAIELNPEFPAAHLSLAVALMRVHRFAEALSEVRKAEQMGADPTRVLEIQGSVQALSGDTAAAQATVDQLRSGAIAGRVSPYSVALIFTAMGRNSAALDWLEKAYREKDTWIVWIKVLVEWDGLRAEPRFKDLLAKLNL